MGLSLPTRAEGAVKKPKHVLWIQSLSRLEAAVNVLEDLVLQVRKHPAAEQEKTQDKADYSLESFLTLEGEPVSRLSVKIEELTAELRSSIF